MFRRKDVRAYTVTFTVLCDLLAIYLAFALAWFLRFKVGLFRVQDTPLIDNYIAVVTLWAGVLILIFYLLGLYNIRTPIPFMTEAARVTQGIFISLAVLFALSFFTQTQYQFSRLTVFLMAILSTICLLIFRNSLRNVWGKFLRENRLLQQVLLIGWSDRSAELVRNIKK